MQREYTTEEQGWIWLNSIPGIGAVKFHSLLDVYKTPREVWQHASSEMLTILSAEELNHLMLARSAEYVKGLFDALQRADSFAICLCSEEYPALLRQIADPPPVLFARGRIATPLEKAISIVGTRTPSRTGLQMAHDLAAGLAENGVTVVSGLARGIDSAAHEGALRGGGYTVAVLGCGTDVIYPPENERLFESVMENGLILSEYPPGTKPLSQNFPSRNRIISGLSSGVVIVEAAQRSGAMITVNDAVAQSRSVFAVPGNVYSKNSYWPNRLLRDTNTVPTLDAYDILDAMRWAQRPKKEGERIEWIPDVSGYGQQAVKIVELLAEENRSQEQLLQALGLDTRILFPLLTTLEINGIIRRLPGNVFSLEQERS